MAERSTIRRSTVSTATQPDGRAYTATPVPSSKNPASQSAPHSHAGAKPRTASTAASLTFAAAVLLVISSAFFVRHEQHIAAEGGIGYWLGITGSLMMLLLLVYPLRKKWRGLARLGRVASWFKLHMVFGILGPTLIVLHSNFKLSSTNATVAMFAMLTVVASGLIGRYLYAKIHFGLYGARAELSNLLFELDTLKEAVSATMNHAPEVDAQFAAFEQAVLVRNGSLLDCLGSAFKVGTHLRQWRAALIDMTSSTLDARGAMSRQPRSNIEQKQRLVVGQIDAYLAALRKAATLDVFERLFALWHVLHLPLFVLLILTAIAHVVAVHLY